MTDDTKARELTLWLLYECKPEDYEGDQVCQRHMVDWPCDEVKDTTRKIQSVLDEARADAKREVWPEAYRQGVEDQIAASESGTDYAPNRANPHDD